MKGLRFAFHSDDDDFDFPLRSSSFTRQILRHPKVDLLDRRHQIAQRTPEWYARRKDLLTASDAAAALGIPPFEKYRGDPREDLLQKKLADQPMGYNAAIAHGVKHEDSVRQALERFLDEPVAEYGLLVHRDHPWLGASPDGVTASGKMVEIKCPMRRTIVPGHVPEHYYPQLQVQMEVCDLDACLFVQWKPPGFFDITVVERDRRWFRQNLDRLRGFFNEYVYRRATYVKEVATCRIDPMLYFL